MTHLLDVNVLIALMDRRHVFHSRAHRWFEQAGSADWATCPTIQNGLIRILGNPRYANHVGPPVLAATMLATLTGLPGHRFWHDNVSLLDETLIDRTKLARSDQITDTYLLALARSNGGRLATLDSRISTAAVEGGAAALFLIPSE